METFNSQLALELAIKQMIKGLKTSQPYNLFCHHVMADKVEDIGAAIEHIKTEGLRCQFETTSRTITHIGTTANYPIENISKYVYIPVDLKVRDIILFAIPKEVKSKSGTFDYSTPIGIYGSQNIDEKHSMLDHTKGDYINPEYILAVIRINEHKKQFSLDINPKHMLKSKKEQSLNTIRQQIEQFVEQNYTTNPKLVNKYAIRLAPELTSTTPSLGKTEQLTSRSKTVR